MEQHDGIKVTINRRRNGERNGAGNEIRNNRPTNSFSSRQRYSGVTSGNSGNVTTENTLLSMIRNFMSSTDPQYDPSIFESTLTPLGSTLARTLTTTLADTSYDFPPTEYTTVSHYPNTFTFPSISNYLTINYDNNIDIPGLVFLRDNEAKKDDSITIDIEENEYEEDTSTDCTVCLVGINKGEKVVKLDCDHVFHINCIDEWVKYKQECPNCRKEIKVKRNQDF